MADGKRSRIERMLERQQADLDSLDQAAERRMFRALADARRELVATLEEMERSGADEATPWTAQQKRVMLAQVDKAEARLRDRLDEALDETTRKTREKALEDLIEVIEANEPEFTDTGGQLQLDMIRRLDDPARLLLQKHSTKRYAADLIGEIQRQLVSGMLQGETIRDLTKRIQGTDGLFKRRRWRAALIARMETNAAYNESHHDALRVAADHLDEPGTTDPLMRRADEFLDRRSHPISWAVNGMVVGMEEPWRVPARDVAAWAERVDRSGGGIVWARAGSDWVGMNYPAHFWERGRQVAFRMSWSEQMDRHFKRQHFGEELPKAANPPTRPSMQPSRSRMPTGEPKDLGPANKKQRASWQRENELSRWLAQRGFRVRQRPERGGGADVLLEGRLAEIYSPQSSSAENIHRRVRRKAKDQSSRFLLDMEQTNLGRTEMGGFLRRKPLSDLDELLVYDDGLYEWSDNAWNRVI